MKYTNENRGKIQNRERARQIIDFSGIRYGNITPTDMDGFFEYHNQAFAFYEFKLIGGEFPRGQRVALQRMVDAITDAQKEAVIFLCRHSAFEPREDISAQDAVVEEIYYRGQWRKGDGRTAKEYTDGFMKWVCGA